MKKQILNLTLGLIATTVAAQKLEFQGISSNLEDLRSSSAAFADIDGDGDQDLLITGRNNNSSSTSNPLYSAKLYKNNGVGSFAEVIGTPFIGVMNSSIAFADIDGDNDQDVLITGYNDAVNYAKLYKNDGTGSFTEITGTPFEAVKNSSIAFADIDGDNDKDVLITGLNISNKRIAKLYKNDGAGVFTVVPGTPFTGVDESSIAFADVDGDNDQDLLITGFTKQSNDPLTALYKNNGSGDFTSAGTSIFDVGASSVAFADVDGDNDQDLLITGWGSNQGNAKLYKNSGTGFFTEVIGVPFTGVENSSIAFADVDGDSDQDVLITGYDGISGYRCKLYQNDGGGNFSEVTSLPFTGISNGEVIFSDVDGDSHPDVLITGKLFTGHPATGSTKLYRNTSCFASLGTDTQTACNSYTWIDGKNYTSSNDTAVHTISGGAANGCDSIVTLNLTIVHPTSGTDIQTACNSYTWIDGKNYTSSNNTAVHTISGGAANGCDSIITLDLTINTIDTSILPSGNSLQANASGAIYRWLDCNAHFNPIIGETAQTFTPNRNGSYALEITQNNCSDTSSCYNIIPVGISSDNHNQTIQIYPNPGTDQFTLKFEAPIHHPAIIIRNLAGQVVLSETYNLTERMLINLEKQVKGIYFIDIYENNNRVYTGKLSKL